MSGALFRRMDTIPSDSLFGMMLADSCERAYAANTDTDENGSVYVDYESIDMWLQGDEDLARSVLESADVLAAFVDDSRRGVMSHDFYRVEVIGDADIAIDVLAGRRRPTPVTV